MRQLLVLMVAVLSILSVQSRPAAAGTVRATDHSSFWLWGGVKPQPAVYRADSLYILQGQVAERKVQEKTKVNVVPQGMTVARLKKGKVWLVYRADTLHWPPDIMETIVARLKLWQRSGNPVVGLQIDFDARTRHLNEYSMFLQKVRTQLPANYQLGITGLLDWCSTGDVEAINRLKNVVDEVVIQTYQGRRTIGNYSAYLPALRRLTLPFRIGLVQDGQWQAPEGLETNPRFQGYVVFLQNQEQRPPGRSS